MLLLFLFQGVVPGHDRHIQFVIHPADVDAQVSACADQLVNLFKKHKSKI